MAITSDDIRAAVAAGIISEAQAASVTALADSRAGARTDLGGLDEPFELFRGFNEIFIVVGLVILFSGWTLVFGMAVGMDLYASSAAGTASGSGVLVPLVGAVGLWFLSRYFTIRRRMVAPSIALVAMFALSIFAAAMSLSLRLSLNFSGQFAFSLGLTTLALVLHFVVFRVPITTAAIAIGVLSTAAAALLATGNALPPTSEEMLALTGQGPFGWLIMGLGIVTFIIALIVDGTDPHRVTRRASSAFWLHVVAAPAIVNTVAVTLVAGPGEERWGLLSVFLLVMAVMAIVIDRRSFLVAGVGYVVAVLYAITDGQYGISILILGIGLVLLGAQWEALRGWMLRTLPAFPGKDRLPPYHTVRDSAER